MMPEDVEKAGEIKRLVYAGRTLAEVGAAVGLAPTSLGVELNRLGIDHARLDDSQKERVVELHGEGASVGRIARKIRCMPSLVTDAISRAEEIKAQAIADLKSVNRQIQKERQAALEAASDARRRAATDERLEAAADRSRETVDILRQRILVLHNRGLRPVEIGDIVCRERTTIVHHLRALGLNPNLMTRTTRAVRDRAEAARTALDLAEAGLSRTDIAVRLGVNARLLGASA